MGLGFRGLSTGRFSCSGDVGFRVESLGFRVQRASQSCE